VSLYHVLLYGTLVFVHKVYLKPTELMNNLLLRGYVCKTRLNEENWQAIMYIWMFSFITIYCFGLLFFSSWL